MRPCVNQRCSSDLCGSLSQPAPCRRGTTNFLHVSASVGIVRRSGDSLSASNRAALPVNRSSLPSVGGPVLWQLPAWLRQADARHHRRESYSESARGQAKRCRGASGGHADTRSEEHTSELQSL